MKAAGEVTFTLPKLIKSQA